MKLDVAKEAFAVAVRSVMGFTKFFPPRPARVISQNDDYSLELKPEGELWPGMSKVPIRTGIPGCRFKVAAGARVLFTFEDGDPKRPIVTGWDEAAVSQLIFKAGIVDLRDKKGRAIACNGDMVMIPTKTGIPVKLIPVDPLTGAPTAPLLTVFNNAVPPVAIGSVLLPLSFQMIAGTAAGGFTIVGQIVAVSPNKS